DRYRVTHGEGVWGCGGDRHRGARLGHRVGRAGDGRSGRRSDGDNSPTTRGGQTAIGIEQGEGGGRRGAQDRERPVVTGVRGAGNRDLGANNEAVRKVGRDGHRVAALGETKRGRDGHGIDDLRATTGRGQVQVSGDIRFGVGEAAGR